MEAEGWADWQLMELLSSGASGTVYRACKRSYPEIRSAIKIIDVPPDGEETDELRKAGVPEEQIRARYRRRKETIVSGIRRMEGFKGLSHLVSVEDFTVVPAIRMEYLKPLKAYLADKRMDEAEVVQMGVELCQALEILHRAGVIHRDIKPDNIFVNDRMPHGVIFKLGDLDALQEMTNPDRGTGIRGTQPYVAPEVLQEQKADERTDLYELGLTLYQAVNGNRLPFLPERQFASHRERVMAAQIRFSGMELPPPKEGSAALFSVLRKACAFRPEDRYQHAAEMREALEALQRPDAETLFGEPAGKAESSPDPAHEKEEGVPGKQDSREEPARPENPDAPAEEQAGTRSAGAETGTKRTRGARYKGIKAAALGLCLILAVGGLIWCLSSAGIAPTKENNAAKSASEQARTEETARDPLGNIIRRIHQRGEKLGLIPDSQGCRIPTSLEDLTELQELDDYLLRECQDGQPGEGSLELVQPTGKSFLYWEDVESRLYLNMDVPDQEEAAAGWVLSMLLEDRVNGWSIERKVEPEAGWRLSWRPPLRTEVDAEYTPEGALIRILRAGKTYEAKDGLPSIQGVEYLPEQGEEEKP